MVEALTPENYLRFLYDPFYTGVLWTTLWIALLTTALCLVLGFPIAYRLARSQSRWKSAGVLLVILPLFIGSTVRALGWMGVLGRGGLLDSAAAAMNPGSSVALLYTPFAVVLGILSINLPYMVLTLQSVIEGIDARVEEAAESLGAEPSRRFLLVVLPLALPGLATGAVLVFILAMNAYATPLLLGGARFQMMAPMLFREYAVNNNWPFAAAIAFILMVTTLTLTAASSAFVQRRYKAA
jgi:putative spermidine/putrescine transport system permease protein